MSSAVSNSTSANPSQNLTEADFLQLLVTQMSSQDPLNPQSDTEFAAQLAQFSALQESTTMQANMATIEADSMIGETVTVTPSGGGSVTGVVSGVEMQASTPYLVVNGQAYGLSQLSSVAPFAAATAANLAPKASQLITPKTK